MGHSCGILFLCVFFVTVYPVNSKLPSKFKRDDHEWSYRGSGPLLWGGKCTTGMKQSPVNIILNNTKEENFTPLIFGDYYERFLNFKAINNGHTLFVTTENKTEVPTFQGAGLEGKYAFHNFHFHWESEHQIDGQRYALEMHLVHYNSIYNNFEAARYKKNGLVVISVLFDQSKEYDYKLVDFLEDALLQATEKNDSSLEVIQGTNYKFGDGKNVYDDPILVYKLRDLLPSNVNQWLRYEGSLTTPHCDETVTWIILLNKMLVSPKILQKLRRLKDYEDHELTENYRPIQNLHDRIIYLNIDEEINVLNAPEEKLKKNNSNVRISNYVLIISLCVFRIWFHSLSQ